MQAGHWTGEQTIQFPRRLQTGSPERCGHPRERSLQEGPRTTDQSLPRVSSEGGSDHTPWAGRGGALTETSRLAYSLSQR